MKNTAENMNNNINLCQPDDKKACVACCGLINHSDISRHNLTRFLEDGQFRTDNSWRYQIEGSYPEQTTSCRESSSHICPFQGFISRGRPGCLIHPLYAGEEQRDMALFGAQACDNYSCPACRLFSDEIKKTIIDTLDDWYLYTIAIIDPMSTIWILEQILSSGMKRRSSEFKKTLTLSIEILAQALNKFNGIVFCYSIEEYEHTGKKFSLSTSNIKSENERQQILQIIGNNK